MKLWTLALGAAVALAAGCDRNSPPTPASAPATAGAGASTTRAPETGPKGDEIKLPASPEGTKGSKAEPDPGDANDHSTPAHDARAKANNGKLNDR